MNWGQCHPCGIAVGRIKCPADFKHALIVPGFTTVDAFTIFMIRKLCCIHGSQADRLYSLSSCMRALPGDLSHLTASESMFPRLQNGHSIYLQSCEEERLSVQNI